jgi:membrane protein YqaA with SNARE-associated domain
LVISSSASTVADVRFLGARPIYRLLRRRATIPFALAATLFGYTFLANVAMAIVPHEPIILWYGPRHGIWLTAAIATAGTLAAAWVDHRVFVPLIQRVQHTAFFAEGSVGWMRARFKRVPFLVLAASGLTPLPFFPFKAMAFAEHYPLGRYLGAIAVGRFPRYVLLAWLGVLIQIPTWVLVLLFAVMILPSVRVAWKRRKGK